jgi:hypothetical protein
VSALSLGLWFHALALASSAGVELDGDSDCPTVAEIAQRLHEVAPATTGEAPIATVVHVSRVDGAVRLELAGAEGQVLATRDLPATEACDDLAAAAAVVIATWQSDLNPRTSPGVDLPATLPETPAPPPVITARPAPAPPRPMFLGVGLLASTAGGQVTPGASLRASVDLGPAWLGLGGALGATTSRTADVTNHPDVARWTRGWLGLGPELHAGRENRLEGHVQGLLGLLRVEGVDLPDAKADTTLELGVGGGVSVAHWVGNAAVWLGVDVLAWPGRQSLSIVGTPDQGSLPRFDLQLAAGMALGR